jgi:hypothetical protein
LALLLLGHTALPAAAQQPAAPEAAPPAAPGGLPNAAPASAPFNLTGVWVDAAPAGFPDAPPLIPAMAKLKADRIKESEKGEASFGSCTPAGFPTVMTYSWPSQFIQLGNQIVVIHEEMNSVRWIWLDGRPLPKLEDVGPTYNGNSIAHWEGKTLVIETANLSTKSEIIVSNRKEPVVTVPHGDKLHVVERIDMAPDGNSFTDRFTITDPDLLTQAWNSAITFRRLPKVEIAEYVCENDRGPKDDSPPPAAGK